MNGPFAVRFIEKEDLPTVCQIEQMRATYVDSDFGEDTRFWMWQESDFLDVIRQRKSSELGTYDTRTIVCEVYEAICGCLAYEIQEDGYEIVCLSTHPEMVDDSVKICLTEFVTNKADKSAKRRKVSFYVVDGDDQNLKFFVQKGWKVKLMPSRVGADAWLCRYEAPEADIPQENDGEEAIA